MSLEQKNQQQLEESQIPESVMLPLEENQASIAGPDKAGSAPKGAPPPDADLTAQKGAFVLPIEVKRDPNPMYAGPENVEKKSEKNLKSYSQFNVRTFELGDTFKTYTANDTQGNASERADMRYGKNVITFTDDYALLGSLIPKEYFDVHSAVLDVVIESFKAHIKPLFIDIGNITITPLSVKDGRMAYQLDHELHGLVHSIPGLGPDGLGKHTYSCNFMQEFLTRIAAAHNGPLTVKNLRAKDSITSIVNSDKRFSLADHQDVIMGQMKSRLFDIMFSYTMNNAYLMPFEALDCINAGSLAYADHPVLTQLNLNERGYFFAPGLSTDGDIQATMVPGILNFHKYFSMNQILGPVLMSLAQSMIQGEILPCCSLDKFPKPPTENTTSLRDQIMPYLAGDELISSNTNRDVTKSRPGLVSNKISSYILSGDSMSFINRLVSWSLAGQTVTLAVTNIGSDDSELDTHLSYIILVCFVPPEFIKDYAIHDASIRSWLRQISRDAGQGPLDVYTDIIRTHGGADPTRARWAYYTDAAIPLKKVDGETPLYGGVDWDVSALVRGELPRPLVKLIAFMNALTRPAVPVKWREGMNVYKQALNVQLDGLQDLLRVIIEFLPIIGECPMFIPPAQGGLLGRFSAFTQPTYVTMYGPSITRFAMGCKNVFMTDKMIELDKMRCKIEIYTHACNVSLGISSPFFIHYMKMINYLFSRYNTVYNAVLERLTVMNRDTPILMRSSLSPVAWQITCSIVHTQVQVPSEITELYIALRKRDEDFPINGFEQYADLFPDQPDFTMLLNTVDRPYFYYRSEGGNLIRERKYFKQLRFLNNKCKGFVITKAKNASLRSIFGNGPPFLLCYDPDEFEHPVKLNPEILYSCFVNNPEMTTQMIKDQLSQRINNINVHALLGDTYTKYTVKHMVIDERYKIASVMPKIDGLTLSVDDVTDRLDLGERTKTGLKALTFKDQVVVIIEPKDTASDVLAWLSLLRSSEALVILPMPSSLYFPTAVPNLDGEAWVQMNANVMPIIDGNRTITGNVLPIVSSSFSLIDGVNQRYVAPADPIPYNFGVVGDTFSVGRPGLIPQMEMKFYPCLGKSFTLEDIIGHNEINITHTTRTAIVPVIPPLCLPGKTGEKLVLNHFSDPWTKSATSTKKDQNAQEISVPTPLIGASIEGAADVGAINT